MNKEVLENSFLEFLQGKGLDLQGLSLQTFPDLFIEYFQNIKFEGFSEENDGDMLLFQSGNYDSEFQINFTRQLYEVFPDESHQIFQLCITFFYDSDDFSDVKSANKWSCDCEDLEVFQQFIFNEQAFMVTIDKLQNKVEFYVDLV